MKHVLGQSASVKMLSSFIRDDKVPHALLFAGPSGCGKTTLARILKRRLECEDYDFFEMNAAESRGIDEVRRIKERLQLNAMGKCRIFLIDECHRLTNDAQSALLKMLEDTPSHVYFFLCTTDRQRMLPTILTRCTDIRLQLLDNQSVRDLIRRVAKKEKLQVHEDVEDLIVEKVNGSARKALVLLEQIMTIEDSDEQVEVISKYEGETEAIELARILINPKSQFGDAAKVLKELKGDPEGARRLVLGYCSAVMLKGGKMASRAYLVWDSFRDNLYDTGFSGLVGSTWEVYHQGD